MEGGASGHDAVVQDHAVGMEATTGPPVVTFMGCAQEEHRAGDFFEHISKILCAHDRRVERDPAFGPKHVLDRLFAELDRAVIADRDGEALFDMNLRAAAMRSSDPRGEAVQFFCYPRALLRRQCANSAKQMRGFRNDIVGRARRDFGDGDDCRVEHRNLARHHCLDGGYNLASDGDWVDGVMRHGCVAARTLYSDCQNIGRCQQRSASAAEHAAGRVGHDVQGKGGVR